MCCASTLESKRTETYRSDPIRFEHTSDALNRSDIPSNKSASIVKSGKTSRRNKIFSQFYFHFCVSWNPLEKILPCQEFPLRPRTLCQYISFANWSGREYRCKTWPFSLKPKTSILMEHKQFSTNIALTNGRSNPWTRVAQKSQIVPQPEEKWQFIKANYSYYNCHWDTPLISCDTPKAFVFSAADLFTTIPRKGNCKERNPNGRCWYIMSTLWMTLWGSRYICIHDDHLSPATM